jgi:hypothetical protein
LPSSVIEIAPIQKSVTHRTPKKELPEIAAAITASSSIYLKWRQNQDEQLKRLVFLATLASQPVVDKRFEEGKRERPGPIRRSTPARMRRPQSAEC